MSKRLIGVVDVSVVTDIVNVLDLALFGSRNEFLDQGGIDAVHQHPFIGHLVDLLAGLDNVEQTLAELVARRLPAAFLALSPEQPRSRLATYHLQALPDAFDRVTGLARHPRYG